MDFPLDEVSVAPVVVLVVADVSLDMTMGGGAAGIADESPNCDCVGGCDFFVHQEPYLSVFLC